MSLTNFSYYLFHRQTVSLLLSQRGSRVVIPLFVFYFLTVLSRKTILPKLYLWMGHLLDPSIVPHSGSCYWDFLRTRWPMYNAVAVIANFKSHSKSQNWGAARIFAKAGIRRDTDRGIGENIERCVSMYSPVNKYGHGEMIWTNSWRHKPPGLEVLQSLILPSLVSFVIS